ncbi:MULTISPECIES: bifunctional 2-polyprenyl-6-hydroxyphenol methylase/3-demethylubiquinol 3-O-methyltransferase UbiG [Corallincola]|uniref:Ubiquinone biosynthesis O-methyltransferase n=3 Tax=Corallincola TaxID=1775176 RepID=A0A368NRS8_9GAMM|nr:MULTISPECIES: bifunctional 2-polyprenyl-6-hydroxyphenol methylase/3-demethylubiquinol 3-O-methyltransferase UbiG [Corallincola]RCU52820.1 bifunctional 2-polyprenyl-6-hydroxyphenol methylase/3-demethylubiquinol 3-O-methyltransferase UbiG [Corallincola holothuriorum]TAA48026.1 bifunctional 2-polyprenyl-6-hydroxyphenol methylase/3-demethylubiquinol 3-O-methyltransferase UbiG [Corallincola spongiicola]TCI03319.1 bifunctional 2-polyprenyl-6-hydroxyphenol methylase/3-demethylubiquinol 3-O-methyltra
MTTTMNVDPKEIAKFEALAHKWWDEQGEFKPLHRMNPVRLKFVADSVGGLFGKRILDVGCGGGILAESMARSGADVTGIDMGEAPLSVARLHALETGTALNYQQQTAEQHAEQHQNTYDVVTCMEMLEHVPDPAATIAACASMVKPGGQIFFSTLNKTAKAWLLAIVGAEYVLKLLPKGTHEFDKFIRPADLVSYAEHAGLSPKQMTGIHYNPLLQTFKLKPNVDVNYMLYCTREE